MGDVVEALMAVMGLAAGLMVVLTTLLFGTTPTGAMRDEWHHDPRAIHLQREPIAA